MKKTLIFLIFSVGMPAFLNCASSLAVANFEVAAKTDSVVVIEMIKYRAQRHVQKKAVTVFSLSEKAGGDIFYWDFGDGTKDTSYSEAYALKESLWLCNDVIRHAYKKPGEYSVALIAKKVKSNSFDTLKKKIEAQFNQ